MTERVAHDHPSIETLPATLGRVGGTTRAEVRIEDDLGVEDGNVVHLVLDGSEYRAMIQEATTVDGTGGTVSLIRGAFDTPRLAREPGSGENHLQRWVDKRELAVGRTVHVDVIEEGFKFGLRGPGERATYSTGRPDSSLADIAERFGL